MTHLELLDCEMAKSALWRRIIGSMLIVSGAVLLWLAPEVWPGLLMIAIAIFLEIIGIALERQAR